MKRILFATMGGLALVVLSVNGNNLQGNPGLEAAISPDAMSRVVSVPIVEVAEAPRLGSRRFVGQVRPLRTVDIAFQVPGQIIELLSEEGSRVAAGTEIARLDPEDHRLALERAEAVLALAKAEHARILELVDRSVAPAAQLERANAELRQAEVAVDQMGRQLEQTVITAPFEALLARRLSETWANVTPAAPVLRLQDVTRLLVSISLPEALAMKARTTPDAFEAVARFPALPEVELPLELERFITEADPVAQTYSVELALQGSDDRILPGMTATVEVRLPSARTGSLVPVSAIDAASATEPRVWVVQDDDTVRAQSVTLGLPQGERIEVLDGLEPGARIVGAGWRQLSDGARVQPAGF